MRLEDDGIGLHHHQYIHGEASMRYESFETIFPSFINILLAVPWWECYALIQPSTQSYHGMCTSLQFEAHPTDILCRYLDLVLPGEYGTAKSPLFCFRPSFWRNMFLSDPREPILSDLNETQDFENPDGTLLY
jgi:hypothetical protein